LTLFSSPPRPTHTPGSALGHFRDGSERPTGNAGKGPLFLLENKKKSLKENASLRRNPLQGPNAGSGPYVVLTGPTLKLSLG